MGTVVEHPTGPRNRWLLPILLALLIAAIILGAIFIPKLTKASASPTATSRVVVVTERPTTAVGTAVVTATGTSSGAGAGPTRTAGTGSTPLPGASPVPTQPGLVLGMITTPAAKVIAAQAGADRKDPAYTFRTDPRQVVLQTLSQEGFKTFTIVSPAATPSPTPHVGADGRPEIQFVVSYQGQNYTVAVAQPAKHGPTGVWFIVTVVKGSQVS